MYRHLLVTKKIRRCHPLYLGLEASGMLLIVHRYTYGVA